MAEASSTTLPNGEPAWLEQQTIAGFRVWHILFFCFSALLSLVVMLCCCVRFRIPRTKQDIEADYQRKKLARKFRTQLARIQNAELDDMDLQGALERVQKDFTRENSDVGQGSLSSIQTIKHSK
ncbi:transmembrane inner ear expressed protein [Ctenocephalides felis]|uniref:transmembrane inner ear expressed protein n=1 Tax=Ctenocephalides felis TaxID=7515 RepID=UPI000E6E304B|nr:transmembrane inner ear expressed protein [Ctenocephalides felis]